MMIFDGHADLLYDVTKWRQAGEDRVFERRHLPRLQAGQIGGLGLSIWTTVEQDSIWSAHPDWDGWRRSGQGPDGAGPGGGPPDAAAEHPAGCVPHQ